MPTNEPLLTSRKTSIIFVLILIAITTKISWAQVSEEVLHSFSFRRDGGAPFAGITADANGNLYGTTYAGGFIIGSICCGTVYQLTPDGKGGWDFHTLFLFNTGDGEAPSGNVIADSAGNLYGTTQEGYFCGNVYKLSPTQTGPWTEQILYSFNNFKTHDITDGCEPSSSLIFAPNGNLYGTAQLTDAQCTATACGAVFQLEPRSTGQWKETVIYRFPSNALDGLNPYGSLVMDSNGNFWGTTLLGGTGGSGTIFELSPSSNGGWSEHVAFNFAGIYGELPYAGLVADAAGNLYGTTYDGGLNGVGLVFKMAPQSDGTLAETILHVFSGCATTECPDGLYPFGGLTFDAQGNLYGTATYGGGVGGTCKSFTSNQDIGCGVLFKLTPNTNGTWEYSIVHRFPGGAHGAYPTDDRLYVDPSGNIFGTTFVEGNIGQTDICPQFVLGLGGCGVVFEVKQ